MNNCCPFATFASCAAAAAANPRHDITVIAAPSESLDIVREREQVATIPITIEREISPVADARTLGVASVAELSPDFVRLRS